MADDRGWRGLRAALGAATVRCGRLIKSEHRIDGRSFVPVVLGSPAGCCKDSAVEHSILRGCCAALRDLHSRPDYLHAGPKGAPAPRRDQSPDKSSLALTAPAKQPGYGEYHVESSNEPERIIPHHHSASPTTLTSYMYLWASISRCC